MPKRYFRFQDEGFNRIIVFLEGAEVGYSYEEKTIQGKKFLYKGRVPFTLHDMRLLRALTVKENVARNLMKLP